MSQRALQVIPVIDMMSGQVVRGIAGRRDEYRPIVSPLVSSSLPLDVGQAFLTTFGLREVYVADLDAIAGAEPDWGSYQRLMSIGLNLWVDAGIADLRRARQLADFQHAGMHLTGVVVGLETLQSAEFLTEALPVIGPERLIFSLDLKQGRPLGSPTEWTSLPPLDIALAAVRKGVRRLIVLDVANVGTDSGCGTIPLCRSIRDRCPDIELIAGGGVRGPEDLCTLTDAGCDAALVASALHDGRLKGSRLEA